MRYPEPPTPQPGQTTQQYGLAVLLFLLTHDLCFGLCSDADLELAHYTAKYATGAADILPIAVERITRVQLEISKVLAWRTAERGTRGESASTTHTPEDSREGGHKVATRPIVPTRPPAPVAIEF